MGQMGRAQPAQAATCPQGSCATQRAASRQTQQVPTPGGGGLGEYIFFCSTTMRACACCNFLCKAATCAPTSGSWNTQREELLRPAHAGPVRRGVEQPRGWVPREAGQGVAGGGAIAALVQHLEQAFPGGCERSIHWGTGDELPTD